MIRTITFTHTLAIIEEKQHFGS